MKKRIMTIALALCLLAVAAMGTIAYFTDTDNDTNVFVVGNVDIEQYEHHFVDGKFVELSANDADSALKLMPVIYTGEGKYGTADEKLLHGQYYTNLDTSHGAALNERYTTIWDEANVVDKFVSVTNTGNNDVYVRTIVATPVAMDDYIELGAAVPGSTWADWDNEPQPMITVDGIDYYCTIFTYVRGDGILEPGKSTGPSLQQVLMYKDVNNDDIPAAYKGGFNILVASQAVQADGFADTFTENIPQNALNEAFGEITATNHPWA